MKKLKRFKKVFEWELEKQKNQFWFSFMSMFGMVSLLYITEVIELITYVIMALIPYFFGLIGAIKRKTYYEEIKNE